MLSDYDKDYLTIRVGETELELLSMGDLPALKVMEMLSAKEDKLQKSLELMELASKDPKRFQAEKEFMSFNELIMLIDVWMDKSSDDATKRKKTMIKSSSVATGKKTSVKKSDIEAISALIDSALDALIPDDGMEDMTEAEIAQLVADSGLNFDGVSPEEAVKQVAMWFVVTGREDLLIAKGLLTTGNRSGKFYPIVDGVTKRRLGFTRSEAKEGFNGTQE